MSKQQYTTESYRQKLQLLHPEIDVIGEYKNSKTKIAVHCNKCGNTWSAEPSSLLQGTGCPKCNKRYRRTTEDFVNELKAINPSITVLGEFQNTSSKILVKCNRCHYEWEANPIGLLRGTSCPNAITRKHLLWNRYYLNPFAQY